MSKIDNWRLVLGYISIFILSVLTIRVNSLPSLAGIASFAIIVAASILLSLADKDPRLEALINTYFYHAEFIGALFAGLFSKQTFSGSRAWFLAGALILYAVTWLLYFKKRRMN